MMHSTLPSFKWLDEIATSDRPRSFDPGCRPFHLSIQNPVSPINIVLTVVACLFFSAPTWADLRVGTSAVKITPPTGTPMAGYYYERGSQDVIDDLYAKAAVLDDGSTKVAMVVCDLISLPRDVVLEARQLIERQTGIPGAHVMMSATHTHTGPALARGSVRDDLDKASSNPAKNYTSELPERIAQAVAEANGKLAAVKVSYARQSEDRLSFCRRFWMKDGTVGWNPGKRNPNIIRPVSPIDPEVGVVYFETPDNKSVLTYVNFAMHADTTGGARISADFPGALARRLVDYRGPDMMTMFANGACGNINHINVHWSGAQSSPAEATRLGTILAADVLKAYMDLKPVTLPPWRGRPALASRGHPGLASEVQSQDTLDTENPGGSDATTLRVRSELLQLPLAKVTPQDVQEAKATIEKKDKARFMEQVKAYKVLDVQKREGKPLEVEVQVITMGDTLAWVSLPGEIFVELGLSIKAASPFAQTHIAELANGSIGYIPNRSAYAEGNYEVESARCAEASGELLVQSAVTMLEELRAGTPSHR
jgi:neutral ceramidase